MEKLDKAGSEKQPPFSDSTIRFAKTPRKALLIEDNPINLEMLTMLLSDDFEILTAVNGQEGLDILSASYRDLSVILLDMYMPVMNGFQFLEAIRGDAFLSSVPVIVTTSSNNPEDEEKCLRLGAADFVSKPYNPQVVLGRIRSTIRLHESVATLSAIEIDELTDVYTMQAFEHHATRQLQSDPREYDLVATSFRRFSLINSVFGKQKGDEVLTHVARHLRSMGPNALIARAGDTFYTLFPSELRSLEEKGIADIKAIAKSAPVPTLSIKCGLYCNVDKSLPVSVMCDHAAHAADSIDKDYSTPVALYSRDMEERRLHEQYLEASFDDALASDEFAAWIQPKVTANTGQIVGAEALVRWITSDGQVVPPGVFIPLFEQDGLISRLDEHMFQKVCRLQRERLTAGLPVVPISINLSRSSLLSENVVERYKAIADTEQIPKQLVPIEITESAADKNIGAAQICQDFVSAGFNIHVDDFGAGYSSFSSLSTFPFSTLKLDKSIIDNANTTKGDIIIRNVIDTAKDLGMEVVAEGVETREQLSFLTAAGCDLIQGFLFSRPVDINRFAELMEDTHQLAIQEQTDNSNKVGFSRLSSGEFRRYLKALKSVFSSVRVLDSDCLGYCMSTPDGTLEERRVPCHEIWDRNERCANCISLKVMESRSILEKFEVFEDEVYLVVSRYFEVDEKPVAVEMLTQVGHDILNGFQHNPQFIDAITKANNDVYRDVQLDIYNRRFYEERLDAIPDVTAVAMVDLDLFKNINDKYGHHVGDLALKTAVDSIKSHIRKEDVIIRYGGDEILIIFSGMKREFLEIRLNDIRHAVEAIHLEGYPDIKITVTIGGHFCGQANRAAIIEADKQMYVAKEQRNCVCVSYVD